MAMSSGAHRAIAEAVSWAAAGAMVLVGLIYHTEIRAGLGLRYEPRQHTALPAKASRDDAADTSKAAREREATVPSGSVRLRADAYGHFSTTAYINGDAVDVLVDTGATAVALTWEDARAAGLHIRESDFTLRSHTANGTAFFAPVVLDSVRIGDITVYDVRAAVARRGQLHKTLLGMSFLGKVRVEMRDRELQLSR